MKEENIPKAGGLKDHPPVLSPVLPSPATLAWCGGCVRSEALLPKHTLPGMD